MSLDPKPGQTAKPKKKKVSNKFIEGWIEFERKSVAKKVASLLNNTQVNTRKKSKQYDCMWNVKYLPNFKWTHLHERLAYEKTARRQKLRAEIQLAKKKTNFFTINLDKHVKNKRFVNKDLTENMNKDIKEDNAEDSVDVEERQEFLKSLFS